MAGARPPGVGAEPTRAPAGQAPAPAFSQLTIAPLIEADWPAVARIYAQGIAAGEVTFEQSVPSWRSGLRLGASAPRLVARGGGGVAGEQAGGRAVDADPVLGWAALGRTSRRAVYRGVGEVSIYVDPACARRGVGASCWMR